MFSCFKICYLLCMAFIYGYIAYRDYRTCYIWDLPIFISILLNLGYAVYSLRFIDCLLGGLLAAIIHGCIYLVTKLIYREEKYGQGDVLLMLSIGTMLGVREFWEYQFLEMTLTGLIAILIIPFKGMKFSVPMAPVYVFWLFVFLVLGKPLLFEKCCAVLAEFL